MKFIGRENEIRKIESAIRKNSMHTILLYGRRRIGKSELIKHILQKNHVRSIYYECRQVTEMSNAQSLANIVSESFHLPSLAFSSFEEILQYIFKLAEKEKIVLVLDEYPYLRENMEGADSILQSLIDQYRSSSNITFILLGSYVEIMQHLIEHENPLYGRFDSIMNLKQMDYYESALFYPNFSNEDKVRIYSVFGGIPYYNRLVDDSLSVKENIIELIASPDARLIHEVAMYLKGEISKIVNANEVFEAMAKGFSKYSDILSQSHVSSGPRLIDILDKLIRMEVVEKRAPINDENNRKKSGYYICDNLSLFYYRYIFSHSSQLNILNPDIFFKKYIEQDFDSDYVPHLFETICKQYFIRQNKLGNIDPVLTNIGKYYYDNPKEKKNGEFDIVSEDELGYIFYEVKFKQKPIPSADIEKEISKVLSTDLHCHQYVFISRSGFEEPNLRDDVKCMMLDDLFL